MQGNDALRLLGLGAPKDPPKKDPAKKNETPLMLQNPKTQTYSPPLPTAIFPSETNKNLNEAPSLMALSQANTTLGPNEVTQGFGGVSLWFNGSTLSLMDNGNIVFSAPAVSGRPLADGSFDYSVARQKMGSTGPIPAGTYNINPKATQWWTNQSFMQRTAAIFKAGTWPGGPISWGVARTWITPDGANVYGRSGFTIHGGFEPGSAGCIDLSGRELGFFRALQNYSNLNSIPLQVKY